eukprot:symbB.v1.2.007572.t1/scaffold461.1/size201717/13
MWWHHVESLGPENISLSLWLHGGALDQRPWPWPTYLDAIPQALAHELIREWEFYLATHIGYGPELEPWGQMYSWMMRNFEHNELFLLWLRFPSSIAIAPPLRWLHCGTLLLQHAVRLLPPQWLPYFLGAFDPQRFHGLDLRRAINLAHHWAQRRQGRKESALYLGSETVKAYRLRWSFVAVVTLRASWRLHDLGRDAWEVEGWPCPRATRKRSGHPRITSAELREVVLAAGLGHRLTMRPDQAKNIDAPHPPAAKVKGLMKAALARCNALLANDALRTMSHLLRKRRMCIDPESFDTISQHLVKSALYLQCPNEEELTVQLMKAGALSDSCQSDSEELMARLVTELLPRWLQEPWALEADKFRLKLAFDCWQGQKDIDVEGVGLLTLICAWPFSQTF